jgi:hypothetical protein
MLSRPGAKAVALNLDDYNLIPFFKSAIPRSSTSST